MYFSKRLLPLFCIMVFAVPALTHAASLYIDPISSSVLKGDTVTVAVRLDTDEGECVNTVDAVLSYSSSIQAIDVSRGQSILSLWVEEPTIKESEHTITFAGGIPNGYCGRIPGDPSLTNIVAELVFRSPGFSVGGGGNNQQALVNFEPATRVLLNDGTGEDAPLRTIGGSIDLLQQVGTSTTDEWRDVVADDAIPPQPFSIELVQNPEVFEGAYYVVFNTTDKQSGIDHYEAIEESRADLYTFRWGRVDAPWVEVKSPYVLNDQSLRSVIRVRAIDKAGNERITVLIPDDSVRSMDAALVFVAIGIGLALLVIVLASLGFLLYRRRKQKSSLDI